MDINIDSLASDVIFSKENKEFFDIINKELLDKHKYYFINANDDLFFKERNYQHNTFLSRALSESKTTFENFCDFSSPLYWYIVFDSIIPSLLLREIKIENIFNFDHMKLQKFLKHIINQNLPKIFEIYEKSNEVPDFHEFNNRKDRFSSLLSSYVSNNFDNLHETFGGFLFLIQCSKKSELISNIIHLYQTHEIFSKYFIDLQKVKKEDLMNFRKFWYYLIKYQKVPIKYIFDFIKNFENDKILKLALNTSICYNHYWEPIAKNRKIFNKLKLYNLYMPDFNMI